MTAPLLQIPQKAIRAAVISDYMLRAGITRAVCFTCGNAARALRIAGVTDLIEVGPRGPLQPAEWWTPAMIAQVWPDRFDATPGHLPYHLMIEVARRIRIAGPPMPGAYRVPTGSGETITCLRIAWPHLDLQPAFSVPGLEAETEPHSEGAISGELLLATPTPLAYDRM